MLDETIPLTQIKLIYRLATSKLIQMVDLTPTEACLELMMNKGGRVVVKYNGDFEQLRLAFHEEWIIEHHTSLSMLTLDLPSHGCLSLLHPLIEFWEQERDDIQPLGENE